MSHVGQPSDPGGQEQVVSSLQHAATHAATRWETGLLLSVIQSGLRRGTVFVDWNKVSEDIGFPPPAVAKAYRTWSDAENVYEKDRVESAIPAFDAYKSLLDKLQRNSSDVDSLTIEELDRALEQKKVDLKGTQTEIAALEEELEIKKEMKGVERRLAAEREKIGKEMREIRKKAEEKVREKKRKLQEVVEIEDDKATASIKKEKI